MALAEICAKVHESVPEEDAGNACGGCEKKDDQGHGPVALPYMGADKGGGDDRGDPRQGGKAQEGGKTDGTGADDIGQKVLWSAGNQKQQEYHKLHFFGILEKVEFSDLICAEKPVYQG